VTLAGSTGTSLPLPENFQVATSTTQASSLSCPALPGTRRFLRCIPSQVCFEPLLILVELLLLVVTCHCQ
jgi:hypothetical protein